jgi:AmiR/NasT family two-component response regulator
VRRAELLSEQLQSALNSRVVIEQAKGAIAQFRHVTVDEAFILLRARARGSGRRLGDLAQAILTDPRTLPDLFEASPTGEGVDLEVTEEGAERTD